MLPWLLLQLFSRIPTTQDIHFPRLSAAFIFASLSASFPASVGLCNFLSESLPARLQICLHTCSSTSAFAFKTFHFRWETEETMVFVISRSLPVWYSFSTEQHHLLSLWKVLYPLSFISPSLPSLSAPSCASVYRQAGRLAADCCLPAKANS